MSMSAKGQRRAEIEGVDIWRCPMPAYAWELMRITIAISETESVTSEGLRMKAIFVLGDDANPLNRSLATAQFASVVRDMLRLGVPA
jgi:hypothetical protein